MPIIDVTTEPETNRDIKGDPVSSGVREKLEVNYATNTPSAGPSRSLPKSPPSPHTPTLPQNPKLSKLAKVSDEIVFEQEDELKISGRIHIQNLTVPDSTLVFKIKTTNPEKFHVWPTIGLISERGSSVSKVTLKLSVDVHSILKDKFQVEVMIVPRNILGNVQSIEEEDQRGNTDDTSRYQRRSSMAGEPGHSVSTLKELNGSWKQIVETGSRIETHRVSISVEYELLDSVNKSQTPPPRIPPLSPEMGGRCQGEGQGDDCSRKIRQLEFKLNNMDMEITEQFSFLQLLLYTIMGLLAIFSIIIFGWAGAFWGIGSDNTNNLLTAPNLGGAASATLDSIAKQVFKTTTGLDYNSPYTGIPSSSAEDKGNNNNENLIKPQPPACPLFG